MAHSVKYHGPDDLGDIAGKEFNNSPPGQPALVGNVPRHATVRAGATQGAQHHPRCCWHPPGSPSRSPWQLTSASLLQMFEAPGLLQWCGALLITSEVNSLAKSLWALRGAWHLHRHPRIDIHLHRGINIETSMKTWPTDECSRSTAGLSSCLAGEERDGMTRSVLEETSLCFSLHPKKGNFFFPAG